MGQDRPDLDDYFYIPNVVYYLENPEEKMSFAVHFFTLCNETISSLSWGVALPFDYIRSLPSYFLNIPYLTCYFAITLAVSGVVLCLGYGALLSNFIKDERKLFWTVLCALLLLSFLTETHRTPGNFALPRLYQGKAWLLTMFAPIYGGAVLQLLRKQDGFSGVALFFWTIAFMGMSSSAIFLLPLLAFIFIASYSVDQRALPSRFSLLSSALSFLPLVGYAAFLLMNNQYDLGVKSPVNVGWPTTFQRHGALLTAGARSWSLYLALFVIIGSIYEFYARKKKFIFSWLSLSFVLAINPVISWYYIEYITSPNAYWRLFYLIPVAPIAAYYTGVWMENTPFLKTSVSWRKWSYPSVCLLLFLASLIPSLGSYIIKIDSSKLFENKLDKNAMQIADKIASEEAGGAMLAPLPISSHLLMKTSRFPQINVRESGMKLWPSESQKKLSECIVRVSQCLERGGCNLEDIEQVAGMECLRYLVLSRNAKDWEKTGALLEQREFKFRKEFSGYRLYGK
jgi:hypothetical protein